MQQLDIEGHIVPHLKDLSHSFLEPEAQGHFRTFRVLYLASKYVTNRVDGLNINLVFANGGKMGQKKAQNMLM